MNTDDAECLQTKETMLKIRVDVLEKETKMADAEDESSATAGPCGLSRPHSSETRRPHDQQVGHLKEWLAAFSEEFQCLHI